MNREIKFRGRHIETGEWVYGYLIGTDVIVGEIVEWDSEYFNTEFWYKVDHETVGQNTGLEDKNGKEIYEGDIVKHETFLERRPIAKVVWADDTCQFGLMEHTGHIREMGSWESDEKYEVISGIYENQNLLE